MNGVSMSLKGVRVWKGLALPGLVAGVSLTLAVVGALLVRDASGVDGVNTFVETLLGNSSSFFGDLGLLAPLGFAFAAGVAAAFNPCGFAMLPTYMGANNDADRAHPIRYLGRALVVVGTVTAGFVVLFSAAGVVIGIGARSALADVLPWLGLSIGTVLAIAGSWLLGGGKLYTGLAMRVAASHGRPRPG